MYSSLRFSLAAVAKHKDMTRDNTQLTLIVLVPLIEQGIKLWYPTVRLSHHILHRQYDRQSAPSARPSDLSSIRIRSSCPTVYIRDHCAIKQRTSSQFPWTLSIPVHLPLRSLSLFIPSRLRVLLFPPLSSPIYLHSPSFLSTSVLPYSLFF